MQDVSAGILGGPGCPADFSALIAPRRGALFKKGTSVTTNPLWRALHEVGGRSRPDFELYDLRCELNRHGILPPGSWGEHGWHWLAAGLLMEELAG
jgi:hypothetical protein